VPVSRRFGVVIVGGGPAGLAVLLAAHKDGRLVELLQQGLLIVEQGTDLGRGQIGSYVINSDSTGFTFVDPLRAGTEPDLHRILETPVARRIAAAGPNAVTLRDAGELLGLVGQALKGIIKRYPQSGVWTQCTAECARVRPGFGWQLNIRDRNGSTQEIQTPRLILATGATQPQARLQREVFAGVPVTRWSDRLVQSGDILTIGGLAATGARLLGVPDPRVAILGGSTSAMSVAHALLHRLPGLHFGEGAVTLFHRHPLRVYYTTPEEALADGYAEFGPGDICPVTNRVFRLSGMRLDSRELLMQVRGIGGRPPEPRIKLYPIQPHDAEAIRLIDSAHLVVAALGYRPNALPILDHAGAEIQLYSQTGPQRPLVDDLCRVLDSHAEPLPGLFGIGLAAGFVPSGRLGGEPNFTGQANGLWLWQNDVGSILVDAVLPPAPAALPPQRTPSRPSQLSVAEAAAIQAGVVAAGSGA
jgi:hypothetical protein